MTNAEVKSVTVLFRQLLDSVTEERRIISEGSEEFLACTQRLIDISKQHTAAATRSVEIIKEITEKLKETE